MDNRHSLEKSESLNELTIMIEINNRLIEILSNPSLITQAVKERGTLPKGSILADYLDGLVQVQTSEKNRISAPNMVNHGVNIKTAEKMNEADMLVLDAVIFKILAEIEEDEVKLDTSEHLEKTAKEIDDHLNAISADATLSTTEKAAYKEQFYASVKYKQHDEEVMNSELRRVQRSEIIKKSFRHLIEKLESNHISLQGQFDKRSKQYQISNASINHLKTLNSQLKVEHFHQSIDKILKQIEQVAQDLNFIYENHTKSRVMKFWKPSNDNKLAPLRGMLLRVFQNKKLTPEQKIQALAAVLEEAFIKEIKAKKLTNREFIEMLNANPKDHYASRLIGVLLAMVSVDQNAFDIKYLKIPKGIFDVQSSQTSKEMSSGVNSGFQGKDERQSAKLKSWK